MDDCSICFEALTASTGHCTLGCSHTFHLACIGRWTNHSSSSCPLCRKELGDTERIVKPVDDVPNLPDLSSIDFASDTPMSRSWAETFGTMVSRPMRFTVGHNEGQTGMLRDLVRIANGPPTVHIELNRLRTIRIGEGIEVTEHDVEEVMSFARVSRSSAILALRENEGNVAEALYDLNQTQPDSRPPIPTRNPLEPTDDMLTAWALERLFSKGTLLGNHGYESLEHVHYRTTQAFRYGFWINPDYRNIPKKHRSDSL